MKLFKSLFSSKDKDKSDNESERTPTSKKDPKEMWQQLETDMTKFADECEEIDTKIAERFKAHIESFLTLERECLDLVNLERQSCTKKISLSEDFHRHMKRILVSKPNIKHIRGHTVYFNQLSSALSPKESQKPFFYKNYALPLIKIPVDINIRAIPSAVDIIKRKGNRAIDRSFSSLMEEVKKCEPKAIPLSTGTATIDGIWGMDVHPSTGNIYVGSQRTGDVFVFSSPENGAPQLVFKLNHQPQIRQVSVVRVSPDGSRFAVVDFTSHQLHVFGAYDGEHIGSYKDGLGQDRNSSAQGTPLSYALAVVFDAENNMYVADSSNRRILCLRSDASLIGSWSDPRIGRAQGLVIDAENRMWVLSIAGKCLNVFSIADGSFIASHSIVGVSDVWPNSLAAGPDNSVLVVDWSGNRIMQVDAATGATLNTLSVNRPSAVAYGPNGSFYFTSYSAGLRVL